MPEVALVLLTLVLAACVAPALSMVCRLQTVQQNYKRSHLARVALRAGVAAALSDQVSGAPTLQLVAKRPSACGRMLSLTGCAITAREPGSHFHYTFPAAGRRSQFALHSPYCMAAMKPFDGHFSRHCLSSFTDTVEHDSLIQVSSCFKL